MPSRPDPAPLIWIVDDSATSAVFTEHSLGTGFRFATFADGASAIERLADVDEQPDLVLLDWVMPGMSGDEVCRYVRQNPHTRDLPIVILTASRTETSDIVCALESGANDYVAKPFVAEELRARVASILRNEMLRRAAERERKRVTATNQLASALFHAGSDVGRVLDAVAAWFVTAVCDHCELALRGTSSAQTIVRHRHSSRSASVPVAIRRTFAIRDLAHAELVLTRDGAPFDASDEETIDSCLEYSGFAIEAALRSEKERATSRFLEEMFGVVAHDLRTPLGALVVGLSLLRDDATEDAARTLTRLDSSTRRMTKIVDQLLDVTRSRIGAGIPIRPRPVHMRSVISAVVDELRAIHEDASFVVSGGDVEGRWDQDRLEQVVSNLANNAQLYGKARGIVELSVTHDHDRAELVVQNELRDTPIAPEVLATLFDPFRRGPESDAKGLGLGLYIASEITRAHGGTIVAESDLRGTRFRVSLPLAGPPASPQPGAR